MRQLRVAALVLFVSFAVAFGREVSPVLSTRGIPTLGSYQAELIRSYVNLDPHLTKGYNALSQFRFREAIPELKQALKNKNPGIASEAATYLGYAAMTVRNAKEAREYYNEAVRLNPNNDLAYFFLANEYFIEGDKGNYRNALLYAIRINPAFVSALRMLAEGYMDEGNPREALIYYNRIVKLLPQSGYYLFQLYRAYKEANMLPEAEKVCLKMIALQPQFLPNYTRLADIYREAGKLDKALATYEEALKQEPNFAPALVGKAKVYIAERKLPLAASLLEEAKRIQPADLDLIQTEKLLAEKQKEALLARWRFGPLVLFVALFLVSLYWGIHHSRRKKEILKVMTWFNRGQEQIYELGELSKYVVNFFMDVTGSQRGALFLYSRQGNQLRLAASRGLENSESFSPLVTGIQVSSWVLQISKPVLKIKELETFFFEEAFPSLKDRLKSEDLSTLVPLAERNLLLGLLALGKSSRLHADLLEPLANVSGRAVESLYLYESSVTDETTGLHNKRFFRQSLQAELRRSDRYSQPCSLLAFDIDDFKKINDTYGHPQGDRVLKELAGSLQDCLREGIDIAARTGGEEFHVILPATDSERAWKVAERIRVAVREREFPGFRDKRRVTLSLGIATYPLHASEEAALVSIADKALYLAKAKGKDRVCLAGELDEEAPPKHEIKPESRLNIFDPATSLYQADYFALRLKEELKRSVRYQFPCSLVILGFETNGNESPFEAIRKFSPVLRESLRMGIDTPAALDREHVGIIIPETEKEKAGAMVRRLQSLAKDFSVSAGIVIFPNDAITEEALLTKAFWALEEAQKNGGNRLVLWNEKSS